MHRTPGTAAQSYDRWRERYVGLERDHAKRSKELAREIARLRKAVSWHGSATAISDLHPLFGHRRRLGHASPALTLSIYSHLFVNSDDRAAAAIDAALDGANKK